VERRERHRLCDHEAKTNDLDSARDGWPTQASFAWVGIFVRVTGNPRSGCPTSRSFETWVRTTHHRGNVVTSLDFSSSALHSFTPTGPVLLVGISAETAPTPRFKLQFDPRFTRRPRCPIGLEPRLMTLISMSELVLPFRQPVRYHLPLRSAVIDADRTHLRR
jgi:hypothetical protein